MAIGIAEILDVVVSHARTTGYFQTVNDYESKQSPTNGITAGIWVENMEPARTSGLASTSVRLELQMRVYHSTYTEPYDEIDSNLTLAVEAFFAELIGDFDLGSNARHVDIYGAYGRSLHVEAGYLNMQGQEVRVFQIRIPVIINDVWAQSP